MPHSLFDNLGSLVLAFILALMVWMVAVNQGQGPLSREAYPEDGLPIEPINIPEGLVISDQLGKRVTVELLAPRPNIAGLSPSNFRVFVDLSGLLPGVHEVPIQAQCAECRQKRVRVLGWEPDRISVKLEELVERLVPVRPNLQGSTAVGYRPQLPPTVDPEQVVVSGPRSLVEQVDTVRADIYLFNEDSTVQKKEVSLTAVDAEGNLVNGVNLNPRRANVTVPIVPEGRRKEVAVTPNVVGTVAQGYYASGISVDPQTVVLAGPLSRIREAPGFVETAPVSIAGARNSVEVQVPIRIPEGLALLDPTHQTVMVRVQVSPFTGGRTFEVAPLIRNLGPGFEAQVSPPRVQVFLSGPVPDLEALTEKDVQVVLDLSDLAPGRHRIQPTVLAGRESLEARTLPDVFEVTITLQKTPTPEPTATSKAVR